MWLCFRGMWVFRIAIAFAAIYVQSNAPNWESRAVIRSLEEHGDPEPLLVSGLELRPLYRPDRLPAAPFPR